MSTLFSRGSGSQEASQEVEIHELHAKIGQLTVERDFYPKGSSDESCRADKRWVTRKHFPLSLSRQCALMSISRASWYYLPKGESEENLALMRRMDDSDELPILRFTPNAAPFAA